MSTICLTSPTLTSIRVASSLTVITTTSNLVVTPADLTTSTSTMCDVRGCFQAFIVDFITGVPVTSQVPVQLTTTQFQTFSTTLFGTSCSVSPLPASPSPPSSSSSSSSSMSSASLIPTTSISTTASLPSPSESHPMIAIIIGTSVAGVAFISVVAFFVWRFTRKVKRSEVDDTNPHPLPVKGTTIAPFGTGRSKAQLMMTAVLTASDSGSRPRGMRLPLGSRQQSQRAAGIQEPSPSAMLRPERRQGQGQGQVQRLRREVEQLRMEMDAIRVGQQLQQDQSRMTEEPPPGYVES